MIFDMYLKMFLAIFSVTCLIICVQSSAVIVENSTKPTAQKSSSCYISNCYSSTKICLGYTCYCKSGYKKTYDSSGSWYCAYTSCSSNSDCYNGYDYNRKCSFGSCDCVSGYQENSDGQCVSKTSCTYNSDCYNSDWHSHCTGGYCYCDYGYYKSWSGLCTLDDYSYTGVWTWAWVFFLIPILIGVSIFLRLRRRRALLQQTHVVHSFPVQQPNIYVGHPPPPPPYSVGQPKMVNVQRY